MKREADFKDRLAVFYAERGRTLPWRQAEPDGSFDPYKILVSEIMLQQTQVLRVIPKYEEFLRRFPTLSALANTQLADVLVAWSGLGYNRRAKYLYEAAKKLVNTIQPWNFEDLVACKGIGPNTAAATLVYSFNLPLLFIETNIRSVLIHEFFHDEQSVTDKEIMVVLAKLLDQEDPRNFYWAMMDYGTYLKATSGNASTRSKHYAKQSKFAGSRRQIRGKILKLLIAGPVDYQATLESINDERFDDVVRALQDEKLIKLQGNMLMLYNG